MKITSDELASLFNGKTGLANFDKLATSQVGEATSWPALLHNAFKPTMFFIFRFGSDGVRNLHVVSKENWCGLHALYSGRDLVYYKIPNMFRTLVCEPPVGLSGGEALVFVTRKNWYKLGIITLLMIRVFLFLLHGLPWKEWLSWKEWLPWG